MLNLTIVLRKEVESETSAQVLIDQLKSLIPPAVNYKMTASTGQQLEPPPEPPA